jgi:hypothetical protein
MEQSMLVLVAVVLVELGAHLGQVALHHMILVV